MSGPNDLPEVCGARHPVTGAPIAIKRGASGYVAWPDSTLTPEAYNAASGIDDAVVNVMIACSMSGRWDNPDVAGMRRSLERGRERKRMEEYRPRKRWEDD